MLSLIGLTLINNSFAEAQTSPAFARQLYINGLAFLTRGLPHDLTPAETASICGALPIAVVSVVEQDRLNDSGLAAPDGATRFSEHRRPPSRLHRALAAIIIFLFWLFAFLSPYLRRVSNRGRQVWSQERTQQAVIWTKTVVTRGLVVAAGGGKWAAEVMMDEKVADMAGIITLWGIEGVTGGIRDGVEKGVEAMNRRTSSVDS